MNRREHENMGATAGFPSIADNMVEHGSLDPHPHSSRTHHVASVGTAGQVSSGTQVAQAGRGTEVVLEAVGLAKSYRKGPVEVPVLRGVDMTVHRGEFLAIVGQSGSGKSTLLHLLGTLDAPDEVLVPILGANMRAILARRRGAPRAACPEPMCARTPNKRSKA